MGELAQMTQFTVGEWTVEPDIGRIRRNEEAHELEPRVMDLLVYLADRAGETVSTDDLAETVWAGRAVTDQPVYQGIAQLRKALDDDSRHPQYIVTVTKKGYRLIAEVGGVEADVVAAGNQVQPPRQQPRVLVPIISLFLAGSYLFFSSSDVSVSREGGNPVPSAYGSIAVLPFIDLSEDGSQQYLGDGIAEEMIHRIAAVPDVRVVARTSSFSFRNNQTDVQSIGEQLGADVILEGSVRRSGDRLRIAAQLVNATDGYHIWSQTFEPAVSDAFIVQDQIANSVAHMLRTGYKGEKIPVRSWTQSPEAADAYFFGMFHMHKRRADSLDKALDYFQLAVTHDPQFALAYAGLSKAYFLASDERYGNIPDDEAMEKSRAATQAAQSLDDRLPEVLEQMAGDAWDRGELDAAEVLLRQAIEINPNYAPAYKALGQLLGISRRADESLSAFRRAVQLDPLSPVLRMNLAQTYRTVNRNAEAEDEILTAIELDPDWHAPYRRLGSVAQSNGQLARSIELLQKAMTVEGPEARWADNAAMGTGYSYLTLGDYASAERWFEKGGELGNDGWIHENFYLHLFLAQDRFDEADALLSQWATQQSNNPFVLGLGGLYRAVMGQNDAAIAMLETVKAMPSDDDWSNLFISDFLYWGYVPAVHLARLYQLIGASEEANHLLDQSEDFVESIDRGNGLSSASYVIASVHALRGNDEDAMASLRSAVDEGWSKLWFTERDPVFARYRGDPEFESILDVIRSHLADERQKLVRLAEAETTP